MGAAEVVRAMMAAVDAGDMGEAAACLAEDFEFRGPVPEPLGKGEWIDLQTRLLAAFPDWSFNLKDLVEEGNLAKTIHRISGTHMDELDLTSMGLPVVPATGISVQLPEEQARCKVEGGRIKVIEIDPNPSGGVMGILAQLGVKLPQRPE